MHCARKSGRAAKESSPAGPGSTSTTSSPLPPLSYIADAVDLIAAEGYRLLPDYRFDPRTGLWRHAGQAPEAPLRLSEVCYRPDGEMSYPRRRGQAGEDAFPGYLRQARTLLAARPADLDEADGLSPDFEALRWFPLPPACLGHSQQAPRHACWPPGSARRLTRVAGFRESTRMRRTDRAWQTRWPAGVSAPCAPCGACAG